MKKAIITLIALCVLSAIYFFLYSVFPKYAYLLPFVILFILLDGYLWFSIQSKIFSFRIIPGYTLTALYWLPFMLLVSSILSGFVLPFTEWNIPYRTYLLGVILIAYAGKFFPIVFLAISDLIRFIRWSVLSVPKGEAYDFKKIRRNKGLILTGWISGALFFLVLTYGMVFGTYAFKVRKVKIALPELPLSFNGIKIVQFSDIHLGSWVSANKLEESVEIINSLHPDMIFFTGDLLNYTTADADRYIDILKKIRIPHAGIFAIMGNHDYGDYVTWPSPGAKKKNLEDLYQLYAELGWYLLRNEHAIIRNGSDSIAVIGVEDWSSARRLQRLADVDLARRGVENMKIQLLLSHDPNHWELVIRKFYPEIDVTFSGHTHGFQLGIEGSDFRWSPAQYMFREWAGLYSQPGIEGHPQYIYVNRGLGTIGYPGRFGIWPEITLITLTNK